MRDVLAVHPCFYLCLVLVIVFGAGGLVFGGLVGWWVGGLVGWCFSVLVFGGLVGRWVGGLSAW